MRINLHAKIACRSKLEKTEKHNIIKNLLIRHFLNSLKLKNVKSIVCLFLFTEKLENTKKYATSFVIDIYFASFPFLFAKKGQWLISINNNHKLEKTEISVCLRT